MNGSLLQRALAFVLAMGIIVGAHGEHHLAPVDLAGVWKVTASSEDGERGMTWTITGEGEALTGSSVDGGSGDERKLDRIKVDEKRVTIEVDFERDGNTGVIRVIAEEKEAGRLSGKWSVVGDDGVEYMSGGLSAVKESGIAYAGDWIAVSVLPDGNEMSAALVLTGENASLKGVFKGENGTLEIDRITAGGKSLRCEFDIEMEGAALAIVIEAEPRGDKRLVGKWIAKGADGAEAATGEWSATRQAGLDLAGAWEVTAALPDGGEYTGTVHLVLTDGEYSGTSKSPDGSERELKSVNVDGKALVLTLDYENEGQSGTLRVAAEHNEDGSLNGRWSLVDGNGSEVAGDSWSATRAGDGRGATRE